MPYDKKNKHFLLHHLSSLYKCLSEMGYLKTDFFSFALVCFKSEMDQNICGKAKSLIFLASVQNIKWVSCIWYMNETSVVIWLNDIFRLGPLMRKVLGWWQKPFSTIITYDEKASSDGLRGLWLLFMCSLGANESWNMSLWSRGHFRVSRDFDLTYSNYKCCSVRFDHE